MRVGLAILIAVVQLAGPWLCCCGPARVVAAFARTKTETRPTPPAPPHCPLCAQSEPNPAPTPEKKPVQPDRCPCGGAEFVALPVSLAKADDGPAVGVPQWEPPSITPLYSFRVRSVALSGDEGLRELPTLTTADRLYAHHVLRC
jgi:hypothetical protein